MGMTVQAFASANCKAIINREIPTEFLDETIGYVLDLAASGDAAANKCIKLLSRGRFRK
jgi:hypothetical protein